MIKWFKSLSTTEKGMLILIILLLIGVATRWSYIKKEGGESIKSRLEIENRLPSK